MIYGTLTGRASLAELLLTAGSPPPTATREARSEPQCARATEYWSLALEILGGSGSKTHIGRTTNQTQRAGQALESNTEMLLPANGHGR